MGEVYAWSNEDEPQLVERFTGVPLESMHGTRVDCVILNTAAGDALFHGAATSAVEELCSQITGSGDVAVQGAAVGGKHFLACTDSGIIFSQGEGDVGQTGQGHGDEVAQPFPLKVASQVQDVQAGVNHSVALARNGTVYAWGTGYYGQHGGAVRRPQMVPRLLSFQKCIISQIAVGDDFSLALATDGRIWAWGANDCGQLGLGDTRARFKPQAVGSTQTSVGDGDVLRNNPLLIPKANNAVKSQWVSIGAGRAHSVACDASGNLFAWGFNMQGQLGQGASRKFSTLPLSVDVSEALSLSSSSSSSSDLEDGDARIAQVGAAAFYSVALSATGKVFCFGQMAVLGQAPAPDAGVPVLVQRLSDAKLRITRLACAHNRVCVYASPIFKSMSFNCSPFRGGTDLKLEGTSFFASDLIRVRFSPVGAAEGLEPIVVGGHYDSSTGDIICTTPPLEDTHPHYIPNEEEFLKAQEEAEEEKAEKAKQADLEGKVRDEGPSTDDADPEAEAAPAAFDPNLHTVVDISLDGGITYSEEKHRFMFYNDPSFDLVSPNLVGNGGRGTHVHISGEGLFRLPEATGAQRSVIGVRFNIFEAKESDATIPPPKKKKKSAKKKGPIRWDPIEHTVVCEANLEEYEDEETGETVFAVICQVPRLDFLQFPQGPLRRGMIEVSMNNSDFPDKEEYDVGLPVEFYVYDSSVKEFEKGKENAADHAVCVRRPGQPTDRTTPLVAVQFTRPLPDPVEVDNSLIAARFEVGGETLELDASACRLVGREAVEVTVPEHLTIPDGRTDAQLSVSMNGGEEFSNPIRVQLYAGLTGVVSQDLSALPANVLPDESAEPAAYTSLPAMVAAGGGVPVCIFPESRDSNWLIPGARPSVQFVDPAAASDDDETSGVLSTVKGADVDIARGCVVVHVPALPKHLSATFDDCSVGEIPSPKLIGVRVSVNGREFLDSAAPNEPTHCVQYFADPVVREVQMWMGPDPVVLARLAEEAAARAAALEAMTDEEKAAAAAEEKRKEKERAKSAKTRKGGRAKAGAADDGEAAGEKAPIVPVSVKIEGRHLASRMPSASGGGVVVRFQRLADGAIVDEAGRVNDEDHSVQCKPPKFSVTAVDGGAKAAAAPGADDGAEQVPTSGITAAVSLNGGQQFSEAVEIVVVDYDEEGEE